MVDRPILMLRGGPSEALPKPKGFPPSKLNVPSRDRQAERLDPRFQALQETLDAQRVQLHAEMQGLEPEQVLVLEIRGGVSDFVRAVKKVEGLEWLFEVELEDLEPDEDFHYLDERGVPREGTSLRGFMYLMFSNRSAQQELLSLWGRWKREKKLGRGYGPWEKVFAQLHDVRFWSARDRLRESGLLETWAKDVAVGKSEVRCEVELWFHRSPERRRAARARLAAIVARAGGSILAESEIESIAYHALLIELPVREIESFVRASSEEWELVQCGDIQFVRTVGQAVDIVPGFDTEPSPLRASITALGELGSPVVALLDGVVLQGHRALNGRLVIDDPDGFEADAPVQHRRHGTAMASLLLHGDLAAGDGASPRMLYVRPILKPEEESDGSRSKELVPSGQLVVDLVHRAVRRLFVGEGAEPPVAKQIAIVNLSLGIRERPFDRELSPLARLLDWLAWEYKVLFVVSSGNHAGPLELDLRPRDLEKIAPEEREAAILRALREDARNRRLLSPAESVNALTVGALDPGPGDAPLPRDIFEPFVRAGLPSPTSARGPGFRRAIKPEILAAGGAQVWRPSFERKERARIELLQQKPARGHLVAAPSETPGRLDFAIRTSGTSNAAALVSRAGAELYDVLEGLRGDPGGELLEEVPRAIWLKALLAHSARWTGAEERLHELFPEDSRSDRARSTHWFGFGAIDVARVREGTAERVVTLSGGRISPGFVATHRLPLPAELGGRRGLKRVIATLAWFAPVRASSSRWAAATLDLDVEQQPLDAKRKQADSHAVARGTLRHEILEDPRAVAFEADGEFLLRVSAKANVDGIQEAIPYALALTLEIGAEFEIDIHAAVQARVQAARVRVGAEARG